MHQQHRRSIAPDEVDRLRFARARPLPERIPAALFGERIKIIGSGQQRRGADDGRVDARVAQIVAVERQHGRIISARAVPAECDPRRVSTEPSDMVLNPTHGLGAIFQEGREADLRHQPVIGQDGDEPA